MAKTRLTAAIKRSVRNAVEYDIPRVDFDSAIHEAIQARALAELPEGAYQFKDYPATEYLGYPLEYLGYPFCCYVKNTNFRPTQEDKDRANELRERLDKQGTDIRSAMRTLELLMCEYRYVEDFIAAHPKFTKYVPGAEEPASTINLRAIQLAEKLQELGWPKSDAGK